MFQFSEELHRDRFFWFEKSLIHNMNWAMLPTRAKAIYPVIRAYCNADGEAFPGEQTIAILSGETEKTVRSGIKALEGFPGIRVEAYLSRRGRSSKRFTCKVPEYRKGSVFPFHKDILLCGNWSLLKPTAQALYPVMRSFSYNDYYEYSTTHEEVEKAEAELEPDWENFKDREFDFCVAEVGVLCDHAHITRRSYWPAVKDLEEHCLVKYIDTEIYGRKIMVYLHPPKYYKRDFLNERIMHKRNIKKAE